MNYKKHTSPEIQTQTSTEKNLGSPFSWVIITFSTQLTSVLSKEKQTKLQEKSERIKVLLKQLEDAVKSRSDEINYDYHENDYVNKLGQDDSVLIKVLQEKVLTGDIKVIYDEIISLVGDNKKIKYVFEQKLFEEFLKDLVYESMTNKDFTHGRSSNCVIDKISSNDDINGYISKLESIKKPGIKIRGLSIWRDMLYEKIGEEGFLNFHKTIVERYGIKYLNIGDNYSLPELLGEDEFLSFIQSVGEKGIKFLNLMGVIQPNKNIDFYKRLFQTAGKAGIVGLNLELNEIGKICDIGGLVELVKYSKSSGIKYLNIARNNLTVGLANTLESETKKIGLTLKT